MNISAAFEVFATRGISVAEYFYREVATAQQQRDFARQFGQSRVWVRQVYSTGRRFFAGGGLRRQAARRAEELGLSLTALITISTGVSHLNKQAAAQEPELLLELVNFAHEQDIEVLKTHVRARVQQLNGPKVASWRRWVRCSKHPDANGMRYLMAKLDDAALAAMENVLVSQAKRLRAKNPHLSQQQALADALVQQVLSTGTPSAPKKREGLILLPADGMRHIGDGLLATTDGAQIPVEQLAAHLLEDFGYAIVYDELCQPVDMFRTKRLANEKQRLMLAADQLLCADPECQRPVLHGQMHHVQAWQYGGETNLHNLVGVCATHNALNDDDRQRRRNGYYERDPATGRAGYQHPAGGALEFNDFPLARKAGRNWALRHFGRLAV